MKILIIPDKFKGSLSAKGVVTAIKKGIEKTVPSAETFSITASDGGDGFLNAVSENFDSKKIEVITVDSLGREIMADYLLNESSGSAYIELAKASGLELLKKTERNAMLTSTLGTGLQIRDAMEKGATGIYIGLGGSATNDAGIGIAYALGYRFFDEHGCDLDPTGKNLARITSIELPENLEKLQRFSFFAVNDVDNPLFGKNGAAYVYALQKGANEKEIEQLDEGLRNLAEVVKRQLGKDDAELSGAGAAGGTAYGLKVFLNAKFLSGTDFVLKLSGVKNLLRKEKFDYIITGEGKFDSQTLHGKLIRGVVDLGRSHNIPVVVVCGMAEVGQNELDGLGLEAVLEIRDKSKSLEYNMKYVSHLIETSVSEFFREGT